MFTLIYARLDFPAVLIVYNTVCAFILGKSYDPDVHMSIFV